MRIFQIVTRSMEGQEVTTSIDLLSIMGIQSPVRSETDDSIYMRVWFRGVEQNLFISTYSVSPPSGKRDADLIKFTEHYNRLIEQWKKATKRAGQ